VAPQRLGNRDRWAAPQGIYRCKGEHRWLAVTVADDAAWVAAAGVIGDPGLATDARYATTVARLAHRDELDAVLGAWAVEQDAVEAFHALQAAGVAAGPLFDDDMLAVDPNVAARGWIRPLTSTDVGTYPHIGHAFTGLPMAWDRGSPVLGEDNEYVFGKLLGLDDETYQRLQAARVIVDDYLDADGNPV
jgi:crotonobetainyl-CoA:carnitine CoA-transferase CaiB-like acyl-CoA transferase